MHPALEDIKPFDKKALCTKCGWSIPDPQPPMGPAKPDPVKPAAKPAAKPTSKEKSADDAPPGLVPTGLAPPPTPPTVAYCNGEDCPYNDGIEMEEHMHQFCDVCSHEWLSLPLDAESNSKP